VNQALIKLVLIILFGHFSKFVSAGNFGTFDPRSQAMGGASIAVGSVGMAAGHNPSLLGLFNEDEDKSRNGRYYLPYVVGSLSQVAIDSIKLINDELDIIFDNALNGYNIDPNQDTAAIASTTAMNLENALLKIANQDITFSLFAPLIAVAEPSKKGGGAFYVGTRIEGGGRSNIPDADVELFDDYVDALNNVANGGYWRDVHPELFNADPAYIDFPPPPLNNPFDQVNSNAEIRGLIINEVAVAGAIGFDRENLRVALGVTPKAMQIRVFDESREVSNDSLDVDTTYEPFTMFNADIGVTIDFDSGVRLAYVGKDLFTRSFLTDSGAIVELNAKHRMGMAYLRPSWQIGVDYDLKLNQPNATERTGQFLSMGGEYTLFGHFALRAGYRFDTDNQLPGLLTFGFGAEWSRAQFNFSYSKSSEEQGAGFQVGFGF
jgi:hypothetical protein